jgi:peptidoglycan/LPS O-acetylase OafA/YrhL
MTGTKESNVYLASKPRYEILDGLRGVAAVFVLVYHLCETHFGLGAAHPLNHGYLAVDFFALSGFVMGYAYDDRWDRMTTWGFFKRRLIRLHPMVICGSVIGALLFYFQQCDAFPGIAQSPWWLVVLAMLWSLQWEYLANILYALIIRRLSTWLLACR